VDADFGEMRAKGVVCVAVVELVRGDRPPALRIVKPSGKASRPRS